MPPDAYPAIFPEHKGISPLATGVAGAVAGALLVGGVIGSRKAGDSENTETKE